MRRTISLEEALEGLRDAAQTMFAAYEEGLRHFNRVISLFETPEARTNRLEAGVMHSCLVEAFVKAFPDYVVPNTKYGRFILRIAETQIIIKRINEAGKPSYVPTILSDKILTQSSASLFDDEDEAAKAEPVLIFGYTRNKVGEFVDPRIVYFKGSPIWVIAADDVMAKVAPVTGTARTERIVVRTKGDKAEAKEVK